MPYIVGQLTLFSSFFFAPFTFIVIRLGHRLRQMPCSHWQQVPPEGYTLVTETAPLSALPSCLVCRRRLDCVAECSVVYFALPVLAKSVGAELVADRPSWSPSVLALFTLIPVPLSNTSTSFHMISRSLPVFASSMTLSSANWLTRKGWNESHLSMGRGEARGSLNLLSSQSPPTRAILRQISTQAALGQPPLRPSDRARGGLQLGAGYKDGPHIPSHEPG